MSTTSRAALTQELQHMRDCSDAALVRGIITFRCPGPTCRTVLISVKLSSMEFNELNVITPWVLNVYSGQSNHLCF
jgi:hypothetical protein